MVERKKTGPARISPPRKMDCDVGSKTGVQR
jgi:hypothetical protein